MVAALERQAAPRPAGRSGPEGTFPCLGVGEVVRRIEAGLRRDGVLADLWVLGEATDVARTTGGNLHFLLRAGESALPAVAFRAGRSLVEQVRDGAELLVHGRVGVYPRRGAYQIIVDDIRTTGAGAQAAELEERRRRLAAEGLFSPGRKRPLPGIPVRVGVATSATGAALQDVVAVLRDRVPVELVVAHCAVQGDDAPSEIARAIARLPAVGCAVVILARGGGPSGDLSAFQSEAVVRAVAGCPVPVVSAVGHETDVTLADLAADVRAATPSHAAQLVVPLRSDLLRQMVAAGAAAASALARRVAADRARVEAAAGAPSLHEPRGRLIGLRIRVEAADHRLRTAFQHRLGALRARTDADALAIEALGPQRILARGFALLRGRDRATIRNTADLLAATEAEVVFHDGAVRIRVIGPVVRDPG